MVSMVSIDVLCIPSSITSGSPPEIWSRIALGIPLKTPTRMYPKMPSVILPKNHTGIPPEIIAQLLLVIHAETAPDVSASSHPELPSGFPYASFITTEIFSTLHLKITPITSPHIYFINAFLQVFKTFF